jgi:hypothetical protein
MPMRASFAAVVLGVTAAACGGRSTQVIGDGNTAGAAGRLTSNDGAANAIGGTTSLDGSGGSTSLDGSGGSMNAADGSPSVGGTPGPAGSTSTATGGSFAVAGSASTATGGSFAAAGSTSTATGGAFAAAGSTSTATGGSSSLGGRNFGAGGVAGRSPARGASGGNAGTSIDTAAECMSAECILASQCDPIGAEYRQAILEATKCDPGVDTCDQLSPFAACACRVYVADDTALLAILAVWHAMGCDELPFSCAICAPVGAYHYCSATTGQCVSSDTPPPSP